MRIRDKIMIAYVGMLALLLLLAGVAYSLLGGTRATLLEGTLRAQRAIASVTALSNIVGPVGSTALFSAGPDDTESAQRFEEVVREAQTRVNAITQMDLRNLPAKSAQRKLLTQWQAYVPQARELLRTPRTEPKDERFAREVLPRVREIRETLEEIVASQLAELDSVTRAETAESAQAKRQILALTLLGILLCAGFIGFLGRLVAQPTRELVASIEALTDNDLDSYVPSARPDEIGAVANALQRLIERVRSTRRHDAQLLRQLERRSDVAMSQLPDAIFLLERDGRIAYANDTAERLTAPIRPERIDQLPWPTVVEQYRIAMATGEPQILAEFDEALRIGPKQNERRYLPKAIPLRNEEGVIEGAVLLLGDVSHFAEIDRLKMDLVATVSHQLKTPLTTMRMSLHLLASSGEQLSEVNRELVSSAIVQTERLIETIEHLLDLARIQSGAIELQRVPLALAEWLRELAARHRPTIVAKGMHFAVEVPDTLPTLPFDPHRLAAAIDNLLNNCAKYCRPGDNVTLAAQALPEGGASISIADTGPGISEQDRARVFDRFYRGPNPDVPGAGLGLAIARETVRAHGGELHLESELGRGTTFTIRLGKRPA